MTDWDIWLTPEKANEVRRLEAERDMYEARWLVAETALGSILVHKAIGDIHDIAHRA